MGPLEVAKLLPRREPIARLWRGWSYGQRFAALSWTVMFGLGCAATWLSFTAAWVLGWMAVLG